MGAAATLAVNHEVVTKPVVLISEDDLDDPVLVEPDVEEERHPAGPQRSGYPCMLQANATAERRLDGVGWQGLADMLVSASGDPQPHVHRTSDKSSGSSLVAFFQRTVQKSCNEPYFFPQRPRWDRLSTTAKKLLWRWPCSRDMQGVVYVA